MQAIYLIKQVASRIAATLRQSHNDHLSATLSRELALASPQMRADIQQLIEGKAADSAASPTASATAQADATRKAQAAVLPNRLRYSTS